MKKPLSIYIICIYAFVGSLIFVLAILGQFIDNSQASRVLFENLQSYIWFQFAGILVLLISALGLWQGAAWGRSLYVAITLILLIIGFAAGLNKLVLINSLVYFVIIAYLLFRLPVRNYLTMPEAEFMNWHESYRVFGKVKSEKSDLSKIFGAILMFIGGMSVAFSAAYFSFNEPVVVIVAFVLTGAGLIMWGTGAYLWGLSRINITSGATLIPAGLMWIFVSFGLFITFQSDLIDDLLGEQKEMMEEIRQQDFINPDITMALGLIGIVMVVAGYTLVTRQMNSDRKYLNEND